MHTVGRGLGSQERERENDAAGREHVGDLDFERVADERDSDGERRTVMGERKRAGRTAGTPGPDRKEQTGRAEDCIARDGAFGSASAKR